MTLSRQNAVWLAALGIPLLLGLLYPVARRIDSINESVQPGRDVLNISSPELLKKMSLGYDALLADVYWTRVVQYYGSKRLERDQNYKLLDTLLNITVTLDPQLLVAYKFGAVFLAEPAPRGAGRPDRAVALIRRGILAFPDDWRLWGDLGFIYYQELKDYKRASEAFFEGSKNPGAREWMKVMAARIAQEGQTRSTSFFLWEQIYNSTQDLNIRKNAEDHMMGLRAEQDAELIAPMIEKFRRRFARPPASMAELVRSGLLPGFPVDPAGYQYQISDGKVVLDGRSPVASPILKKETSR